MRRPSISNRVGGNKNKSNASNEKRNVVCLNYYYSCGFLLIGIVIYFRWLDRWLYEVLSLCSYVMKANPLRILTSIKMKQNDRTTDYSVDVNCSYATQSPPSLGLDEKSMSFSDAHACKQLGEDDNTMKKKSQTETNETHFITTLLSEDVHDAGVRTDSGKHHNLVYYHYNVNTGSFHLKEAYATFPNTPYKTIWKQSNQYDSSFQSSLALSGNYLPAICPDGKTYGFSDLSTLRNAIHELSDAYSSAVKMYGDFRGMLREHLELTMTSPKIVIEEPPSIPQYVKDFLNIVPDPFIICPHANLRSSIHDNVQAIYINAEDITIQCDSCIIRAKGTHFEFGPLARNVLVKGLALVGATDTSIVIRHDGASGVFEDCFFHQNLSVYPHGSVLDMNSTSSLEFHRCYIIESTLSSPTWNKNKISSTMPSLTIRNKDLKLFHNKS